jgi:single-strand DNA-binding protein
MINKVILLGNIGKDAESKDLSGGTTLISFSVATSKNFKKGNDWESKTTWHNIKYFSKNDPTALMTRLVKGASVFVEGEIETREYEGKYYTDIVANSVRTIGKSSSEGGNAVSPAQDDDLPF